MACATGISISFFGFACKQAVSPTSFLVLGILNKVRTPTGIHVESSCSALIVSFLSYWEKYSYDLYDFLILLMYKKNIFWIGATDKGIGFFSQFFSLMISLHKLVSCAVV